MISDRPVTNRRLTASARSLVLNTCSRYSWPAACHCGIATITRANATNRYTNMVMISTLTGSSSSTVGR